VSPEPLVFLLGGLISWMLVVMAHGNHRTEDRAFARMIGQVALLAAALAAAVVLPVVLGF
jgi:hypothetical protein